MKIFPTPFRREEYLETQIQRSDSKFEYCKVSIRDAVDCLRRIQTHEKKLGRRPEVGPIVCLGTRNGREVDLFRAAAFRPGAAVVTAWLERNDKGFHALTDDWLLARSRSRVSELGPTSVLGVEINPRAQRDDVWVGSFDQMPSEWGSRFGLIYSNSFDQSQDPERSACEWMRICRPGGYIVLGFNPDQEPSDHDPVGRLKPADLERLFAGEMIGFVQLATANGYSEVIIRKAIS